MDAYSSANLLPAAFRRYGADVVHVQSSAQIPAVYAQSFRREEFEHNIVHLGNVVATCKKLSVLGVTQIVSGTEIGVQVAEELAAHYGCPLNPARSIGARRDKFEMIRKLSDAGVPTADQSLCSTLQDVREFCNRHPGRVVLKPVNSAGSDDVHFCQSGPQAEAAFASIVRKDNLLDLPNQSAVIQTYLDGTEYYVNTMSRDGKHRVAEIWETTHISANGTYNLLDSGILMPSEGELQDQLVRYAFDCLDCLEVENSPAHMEIKMTAQGPKLIEMGARVVGGPLSRIARFGLEASQLDVIAAGYCDKDRFLSGLDTRYSPSQYVAAVSLIAPVSGRVNGYPGLAAVRELESFREAMILVQPGEPITRTHNDFTYPMMIILSHSDRSIVARDSRTIRHLDGEQFYDITT